MKSSKLALLAAATMCIIIAPRSHAANSTPPAPPTGWLTANPGIARVGSNPLVKWSINYPSVVADYVTVTLPATVTPKQKLNMTVRVLGAGVTTSNANGSNLSFVPTEAKLSYAGGSYQRIFYGTNNDVNPNTIVYSGSVEKDQPIRFGGRYYYSGSWSTFYSSTSGTQNVRTLVNGQVPPTTYPLHTAPTLESFLKPYLDASGKVMIGPMDVIVFMELTHTDAQNTQTGYDLQDMVLLVTFK